MLTSLRSIIAQSVNSRINDGFSAREVADQIKSDHPGDYRQWADGLAYRQLINEIQKYANEQTKAGVDAQAST